MFRCLRATRTGLSNRERKNSEPTEPGAGSHDRVQQRLAQKSTGVPAITNQICRLSQYPANGAIVFYPLFNRCPTLQVDPKMKSSNSEGVEEHLSSAAIIPWSALSGATDIVIVTRNIETVHSEGLAVFYA